VCTYILRSRVPLVKVTRESAAARRRSPPPEASGEGTWALWYPLFVMATVPSLDVMNPPTSPMPVTPTSPSARPPRSVVPRRDRPVSFYDLSLPELQERLAAIGQPAYRAHQLYDWAYKRLAGAYEEMTSLPTALRRDLAAGLPLATMQPVREVATDGGETIKTLYRTFDGQYVETVLMLYPERATICVSCQVGCAVGCAFCATGLGGLNRNLTTGEMVQQAIDAARRARDLGRTLTNLVMMGMGEPFHNYEATLKFVAILNDPHGLHLGARRMTISTSGVIPMIDRLAAEPYQVNLAVSLHAPDDDLRSRLVPLNRRYPIADLLAACRRYVARTGRRVSFEYALMKGINDSDEIAQALGELLRGTLGHVNVIPLNPVDVLPYERPDKAGIDRFAAIVRASGVPTTVRYSRGVEIAAACGQLRAQQVAVPA
jgi:23S rRNA (adenine2503-C2)-methyltransferase